MNCKCLYLLSANCNGVAVFLLEIVTCWWNVVEVAVHFFANQFLTQKFTAFKHPWNIIQRTEVFRSRWEFTFFISGTTTIMMRKKFLNFSKVHSLFYRGRIYLLGEIVSTGQFLLVGECLKGKLFWLVRWRFWHWWHHHLKFRQQFQRSPSLCRWKFAHLIYNLSTNAISFPLLAVRLDEVFQRLNEWNRKLRGKIRNFAQNCILNDFNKTNTQTSKSEYCSRGEIIQLQMHTEIR